MEKLDRAWHSPEEQYTLPQQGCTYAVSDLWGSQIGGGGATHPELREAAEIEMVETDRGRRV